MDQYGGDQRWQHEQDDLSTLPHNVPSVLLFEDVDHIMPLFYSFEGCEIKPSKPGSVPGSKEPFVPGAILAETPGQKHDSSGGIQC